MLSQYAKRTQAGFALPAALLLLLVLSAIAVGMIHMVQTEMRVGGTDLDSTSAYYAAEAGMEKMMADLAALYTSRQAPTISEIQSIASLIPELGELEYPEYSLTVPNTGGNPKAEVRNIQAGAHAGLVASIIPMKLTVTGRGPGGAEVKMERDVQVALIPVFQFGMFSDLDLAFHAGDLFDFGGRTHTNGNLFLAASSSGQLWFKAKVSAAGEIIRARMLNGMTTTAAGRTGPIYIPTVPNGCSNGSSGLSTGSCRALGMSEGSVVGGPGSAENSAWSNLSLSTYHSMVVSGRTGGKALELPFVSEGADEIEIIKRAPFGESPTSAVGRARLYNQAQIRVLLNDELADLPGGLGIELDNVAPYLDGGMHGATNTAFADASSGGPTVIGGYLLVEANRGDGAFVDVTSEWLDLGIAFENPDAILRFQRLKDNDGNGTTDYSNTAANRATGWRFQPLNLYDAREGEVRDDWRGSSSRSCAIGGIMNIVELDVENLKRWLHGAIGLTGSQTESVSQNGYIFYFSDRRGMLNDQGEYGFEDIINPNSSSGKPDGILQDPEDVNGDGVLDTNGGENLGDAYGEANGDPTIRLDDCDQGRLKRVSGARHALRLVNGQLGKLPYSLASGGGFTAAAENPVYVIGDYNADGGWGAGDHVPAAIIADAVTLLSEDWEDWTSFHHPAYPGSSTARRATESWFRVAVATGKNKAFPITSALSGNQHYGLDGGTHNFLRFLERWTGVTNHYQGSLVSFFYSRQGTGIFKCCNTVYVFPERDYSFDNDFLDPSKLPPGTPRFQDIVNLGYRQVFDPLVTASNQ